jgi:hypothetical protein
MQLARHFDAFSAGLSLGFLERGGTPRAIFLKNV